jgi:hypothetical protein
MTRSFHTRLTGSPAKEMQPSPRYRPSRYASSAPGSGSVGSSAQRGQEGGEPSFSGWSRQSRKVARLMPVDMLMARRANPFSMSASARARASELYTAAVSTRPPTKPQVACPGWDSNPHCAPFESVGSAGWPTGACAPSRDRARCQCTARL